MTAEDDDYDFEHPLSAYAVRVSEDNQVVGIFMASDLDRLAYLVDQCCDPAGTEYLRLGEGGYYVGGRTDAQWPARNVHDDDGNPVDVPPEDADPLKGGGLDDLWWQTMDQGTWFPLELERLPTPVPRPARRRR